MRQSLLSTEIRPTWGQTPHPSEWERYSFCVRILEVFLVASLFSGVEIGNKHRSVRLATVGCPLLVSGWDRTISGEGFSVVFICIAVCLCLLPALVNREQWRGGCSARVKEMVSLLLVRCAICDVVVILLEV